MVIKVEEEYQRITVSMKPDEADSIAKSRKYDSYKTMLSTNQGAHSFVDALMLDIKEKGIVLPFPKDVRVFRLVASYTKAKLQVTIEPMEFAVLPSNNEAGNAIRDFLENAPADFFEKLLKDCSEEQIRQLFDEIEKQSDRKLCNNRIAPVKKRYVMYGFDSIRETIDAAVYVKTGEALQRKGRYYIATDGPNLSLLEHCTSEQKAYYEREDVLFGIEDGQMKTPEHNYRIR